MICDNRIAARVEGKTYKMVVGPAVMHCLVTVALQKKTGDQAGRDEDFS